MSIRKGAVAGLAALTLTAGTLQLAACGGSDHTTKSVTTRETTETPTGQATTTTTTEKHE